MLEIVNVEFVNKSNIINNTEIRELLIDDINNKLNNLKEDNTPIIIPGIFNGENDKNEEVDTIFLFVVMKDENIECEDLFKAVKALREFCLKEDFKINYYDEFNISYSELGGVKNYITDDILDNMINFLLKPIEN